MAIDPASPAALCKYVYNNSAVITITQNYKLYIGFFDL